MFRFLLRTEVREGDLHCCVLASPELLAPASNLRNEEMLLEGNGVKRSEEDTGVWAWLVTLHYQRALWCQGVGCCDH